MACSCPLGNRMIPVNTYTPTSCSSSRYRPSQPAAKGPEVNTHSPQRLKIDSEICRTPGCNSNRNTSLRPSALGVNAAEAIVLVCLFYPLQRGIGRTNGYGYAGCAGAPYCSGIICLKGNYSSDGQLLIFSQICRLRIYYPEYFFI